ncbi:hypothetical protein PR003_g20027 [Phytophthora rubi]|uniref:Uncharacterized protein n=1 Tax=Phytophthora rubi TaxID=129364 RepID=A0A6A4DN42_9STRA|nr:hypothetical protein PR001_g9583 [Phytophthora rubi]KAE9311395.1 hypothetical protein PR003_g20027 [Phytophthora rubi]
MEAETTRQAELVAFSNRLAEEERRLLAEADDLKAGHESVKDEWVKLEMEQSRHDLHVSTAKQRYADWQRAIETAKYGRDVAIKNAEYLRYECDQEIKRANELNMKLASYDACWDTEHCIEDFVSKRIRDYLKMSRLERCRVVVEQRKTSNRKTQPAWNKTSMSFFKRGTSCATNLVLLIRQTTPRFTSVASRFNVA